jgi:hypothetical protein
MSNSWRGPKQDAPKALDRGRPGLPEAPLQPTPAAGPSTAPALAPDTAPLSPARPIGEPPAKPPADAAAPPRPTFKAAPKAQIEVRTHTDPPAKPHARPRIDFTRIQSALSRAINWLGGVALSGAALLRDQWQRLARRFQGRWQGRSKGHMPRQTVVIGFAALAVLILGLFWFTREPDPKATAPGADSIKDANLTALHPLEPAPANPTTRRSPGAASPGTTTKNAGANSATNPGTAPGVTPPPAGLPPGQPRPKLSRLAVDPREKGKRFFTLASYSVSREEYMLPLLEFLWSQGVEAAAVQAHNSKNFAVVALQGFTRDEVNSKAHKQYEDTLRAVGKKWKAESGGDDNLQGLYLQEYAGTPAKLSITKAN